MVERSIPTIDQAVSITPCNLFYSWPFQLPRCNVVEVQESIHCHPESRQSLKELDLLMGFHCDYIHVLGPAQMFRDMDVCKHELVDSLHCQRVNKDRFVGPWLSPLKVNNWLLGHADVDSKIVLAPFNLPPIFQFISTCWRWYSRRRCRRRWYCRRRFRQRRYLQQT